MHTNIDAYIHTYMKIHTFFHDHHTNVSHIPFTVSWITSHIMKISFDPLITPSIILSTAPEGATDAGPVAAAAAAAAAIGGVYLFVSVP